MLVAFDLDDTLIDTKNSLIRARKDVISSSFESMDPSEIDQALIVWLLASNYFNSFDLKNIISVISFEMSANPKKELDYDYLSRLYEKKEIDYLKSKKGAVDFIAYLISQNFKLAIVSNGDVNKQRVKMREVGLDKYFDDSLIVVHDIYHKSCKPSPDPFIYLSNITSKRTSEFIYIGDRLTDIVSANLAGCTSVIMDSDNLMPGSRSFVGSLSCERPSYVCQDFEELRGLLENA